MTAEVTLGTVGGEYMESAVLVEWCVPDGARVAAGDIVAVVETAKAATEIEAPAEGVLRILVPAGDEIAVGTVLARLDDEQSHPPLRKEFGGEGPAADMSLSPRDCRGGALGERGGTVDPRHQARFHPPLTPPSPLNEELGGERGEAPAGIRRRWPQAYASPLAKRLAVARGIDLSRVRGTGPGGRIVQADLPESARGATDSRFRMALDIDATALRAARATRWEAGARPSLGQVVTEAVRAVLAGAGLSGPVVLDENAPPVDALAVLDLATFGIAEFTPPHLPCRAVLGLAAPHADTLRLTLAADARAFACTDSARFLALLRIALEGLADA